MKLRFSESKIRHWTERYGPQSTQTQFVKLNPKCKNAVTLPKTNCKKLHIGNHRGLRGTLKKMILTT